MDIGITDRCKLCGGKCTPEEAGYCHGCRQASYGTCASCGRELGADEGRQIGELNGEPILTCGRHDHAC